MIMLMGLSVGIVGASGYTGAELLRLIAAHPDLTVVYATGDSQAGQRADTLYPSLTGGSAVWSTSRPPSV